MAKLTVSNKGKLKQRLKTFNCFIEKLCTHTKFLPNTLRHDGVNPLPVDGDRIFTMLTMSGQEPTPFTNNTAAITISNFDDGASIIYIITDYLGYCTLDNCKLKLTQKKP